MRYFLFQLLQLAVAYLGYTGIVALAFGTFSFEPQLFHLLFGLLHLVYLRLLTFPFGAEVVFLFAQFGNILVQLGNLFRIILALNGFALNLELRTLTRDIIEFLGY